MAVALTAAGLALTAFVSPGTSASPQSIPADPQPTCTVPGATFNSWFQSLTPSLNGVVNPANSVTFLNSANNCIFYQWSEQMFLWLTSPAPATYGGGGGRIFDSPTFFDVSPPDASGHRTFIPHVPGRIRVFNLRAAQVGPHGLPVVMAKSGKLLEIEPPQIAASGKQLILNRAGKQIEIESATIAANGKPVFLNKAGKTILSPKPVIRPQLSKTRTVQKFIINGRPIFLNPFGAVIDVEEGQAGGNGVLEAQNNSLVYYATMVNDVYAYFLTGTKDGGITPTPTQFPTTAANLAQITAFASAHGRTFPDPNALAIEVKSSWVEASSLPNPGDYITMQATIPTYNTSNPNLWTPLSQKTVVLALVGVHVVGSAKGHPEMIWATFEHFNNSPLATYTYNATTGPNPHTVAQNTAGTWLFSTNGSAGPFNALHMSYSSPNIVSVSPFTISPSDTLRWKAWGAASDATPNPLDASVAASNTEVISINNSVLGQLIGSDIRKKYFMTGATWTIGGAAPTGSFPSGNEVGTSKLANTTMETYHQGTNALVATGTNCFSCHQSNTTSVSHIFPVLQPLF